MPDYTSKEELKNAIRVSFAKYIVEFDDIPEELKDTRRPNCDMTPAENLAYQLGWTTKITRAERDERCGEYVSHESGQMTGNHAQELSRGYQKEFSFLSLQELKDRLSLNIRKILAMLDTMSEEDVLEPHRRKWADDATKDAVWPVARVVHMCTIAPFGSFRTKIRKWKRSCGTFRPPL